jgi:transcriptional regulator with XRE-family HTH domain
MEGDFALESKRTFLKNILAFEDDDGIGEAIKRTRMAREMTQSDLAGRVGASQNHISQIESGKTKPSIGLLQLIDSAFEIDTQERLIRADRERFSPSPGQSPYVPNDGTKGRVRNPDDMLVGDHKGLMN